MMGRMRRRLLLSGLIAAGLIGLGTPAQAHHGGPDACVIVWATSHKICVTLPERLL